MHKDGKMEGREREEEEEVVGGETKTSIGQEIEFVAEELERTPPPERLLQL